jgi:hypothetical protein
MPAFDIDSHSPGGSFEPQPADNWSIPLGRIAGIQFFVSYSIFVALAVLAGLVAMVQNRGENNADLPAIAMTAAAIWSFGWVVQLIVQLLLHFGTTASSESITIGLLGIEMGNPLYRRHPWSAAANLASALVSFAALALFGAGCLLIHIWTLPGDASDWSVWGSELSKPGFGLDALGNCYLSAMWLFWIQAASQAYPLPRNLGRGALASAITLFAAEADDELQFKLLRRFLQLIAIVTMVLATATMIANSQAYLPQWPILVLLAMFLWFSTNKQDLRDWITSIHIAEADPISGHVGTSFSDRDDFGDVTGELDENDSLRTPWISDMIDSVRMRQKRKRAMLAMRREREEASDAARLDEVLEIVSERGAQSLSNEDKALLQRVSDHLRRSRKPDEDQPDQTS